MQTPATDVLPDPNWSYHARHPAERPSRDAPAATSMLAPAPQTAALPYSERKFGGSVLNSGLSSIGGPAARTAAVESRPSAAALSPLPSPPSRSQFETPARPGALYSKSASAHAAEQQCSTFCHPKKPRAAMCAVGVQDGLRGCVRPGQGLEALATSAHPGSMRMTLALLPAAAIWMRLRQCRTEQCGKRQQARPRAGTRRQCQAASAAAQLRVSRRLCSLLLGRR